MNSAVSGDGGRLQRAHIKQKRATAQWRWIQITSRKAHTALMNPDGQTAHWFLKPGHWALSVHWPVKGTSLHLPCLIKVPSQVDRIVLLKVSIPCGRALVCVCVWWGYLYLKLMHSLSFNPPAFPSHLDIFEPSLIFWPFQTRKRMVIPVCKTTLFCAFATFLSIKTGGNMQNISRNIYRWEVKHLNSTHQ